MIALALRQSFLGYRRWLSERRTGNTVAAYESDLKRFFLWADAQGVEDASGLTPALVLGYLRHSRAEGRSPNTVARRLAVLRSFGDYLVSQEGCGENPAAFVPGVKRLAVKPVPITPEEMDAVRHAYEIGTRDRALIECLAVGLKVDEVRRLRLEQIDPEQGVICTGGREVYLHAEAVGALGAFITGAWETWRKRQGEQLVFLNNLGRQMSRQTVWKLAKEAGKMVGVNASAESLRQARVAEMFALGLGIQEVKAQLGYADDYSAYRQGRHARRAAQCVQSA